MYNKDNFTCPYCSNTTTLSSDFYHEFEQQLNIKIPKKHKDSTFVEVIAITCPNPNCQEFILSERLLTRKTKYTSTPYGGTKFAGYEGEKVLDQWKLVPASSIKTFPNYIPKALIDDYTEACLIKDLSPKSSATLSRRCLQGMIRDFWGIKKRKLKDAIDALEGAVDQDIWDAIDAIRNIGNIGAHMEEDINLIIDIEPQEAQMLIGLIEILFEEWYVKKHQKEEKIVQLTNLSTEKEKLKNKNKKR